ncbi:MAG: hypothetical protein MI865_13210 [Proteobacteria bacterium]|nr:hypothetical protein [Pseudomonadota bacterium]
MLSINAESAEQRFQCKITSVLDLNHNGQLITHGWSANYLNREFTLDRKTGRVLSTTALKVRLSNFDKVHQPVVMDKEVYYAVTTFEDRNTFASIEIVKNPEAHAMPYFYRTNIGMMLAGTCDQI